MKSCNCRVFDADGSNHFFVVEAKMLALPEFQEIHAAKASLPALHYLTHDTHLAPSKR